MAEAESTAPASEEKPKEKKKIQGPKTGIAVGLNHGFIVTRREPRIRPSQRRGTLNIRLKLIREIVREVTGWSPYEKRIMEILKGGGNNPAKRATKFAKRRLGTHTRAKRKVEELGKVIAETKRKEAAVKKDKKDKGVKKAPAKKTKETTTKKKPAAKKAAGKAAAAPAKKGADKAAKGGDKPAKGGDKPAKGGDKPAKDAAKPAKSAAAPKAAPAAKPAKDAKPAGAKDKAAKGGDKAQKKAK